MGVSWQFPQEPSDDNFTEKHTVVIASFDLLNCIVQNRIS